MSNTRKDGSMSAARAASTPKPKLVVKDRKNLYDFDKGSIGSIVIGAGLQERRSEVAGNYWEGRLPFNGGSLPFIVRGLADDFVPGNRNAFTGLLRIWTKTDNGGNNGTDRVTVGVTVQVVSDDGTKVFDLADVTHAVVFDSIDAPNGGLDFSVNIPRSVMMVGIDSIQQPEPEVMSEPVADAA